MSALTREKLAQAHKLVSESELDVWITYVRETAEGGDPVLPLILEGGLTWESALIIARDGRKVAIVGNYDADPLRASGDWDEVVPYVQSIREPLLETLESLIPIREPEPRTDPAKVVSALIAPTLEAGIEAAVGAEHRPRIGVNYSRDDDKADGLTHGMFLNLRERLAGTRFEASLVSAASVVVPLRARKTPSELAAMRGAVEETNAIFQRVHKEVRPGMTEREVYDLIQGWIAANGLGYAWDKAGDPIVNSGPNSMIGHGIPSDQIRIEPGHIFHLDLGVVKNGYSSDIQRCWYVPEPVETDLPDDVRQALDAVVGAISAGAEALEVGVEGWKVDEAARNFLVSKGYPEYLHAFGHQVGRLAHDGGGILGPKWDRYGKTPMQPVSEHEVYTLELGVTVEGRGYLGIEEMVCVREHGLEWLTDRQTEMPLLG
jgi:Xaa-Pro dipeptidase